MDFNLRVHSAGLLLCRFNRFSVMKKQIAVGGLRSLHVTSKVGGPRAWLRLPLGLRRAVGKRGGRWRGGRAAVSLSVGWAPRPGSVGKGFQPSPLRHVHLQPPRALLPARVLPGGSCAPVCHCARRALVRLLCGTELWGAGVVPAPLRAPGPGPGRMRSERRRPVIAMLSVPGPASGCADVIPLRRRWLGRPGVSVRGHGEPRAPSARK